MLLNQVSLWVKLLVSRLMGLIILDQRLWLVKIRFLNDFGWGKMSLVVLIGFYVLLLSGGELLLFLSMGWGHALGPHLLHFHQGEQIRLLLVDTLLDLLGRHLEYLAICRLLRIFHFFHANLIFPQLDAVVHLLVLGHHRVGIRLQPLLFGRHRVVELRGAFAECVVENLHARWLDRDKLLLLHQFVGRLQLLGWLYLRTNMVVLGLELHRLATLFPLLDLLKLVVEHVPFDFVFVCLGRGGWTLLKLSAELFGRKDELLELAQGKNELGRAAILGVDDVDLGGTYVLGVSAAIPLLRSARGHSHELLKTLVATHRPGLHSS